MIKRSPHVRSIRIAVWRGKARIGIRKVRATRSFVRNVAVVISQTSLWWFFCEASCEI